MEAAQRGSKDLQQKNLEECQFNNFDHPILRI